MQPSEHMDFAQGMPAMSEISDMKMASTREIKLMRKGERRILEYTAGSETELFTHGSSINFTLNSPDAHFIDTNRMYIKAEMAIIDNSQVVTTNVAAGYHVPFTYPSAIKETAYPIHHKRSLFHLAHGTHTVFNRMIVKNGSETLEDNKAFHQSNVMKAIMGHSAVPKDDICGFWNSDALTARPGAMYNVRGRDDAGALHPYIEQNNPDIHYAPVIIPISNVLENQPYLALHNFASTLEMEMEIAPSEHIFTPLITEERLEEWVKNHNVTLAEVGSYVGLSYKTIDVKLCLRKVKLVVEGLLLDDVTQLNTVSQSFPAIMVQSFKKNQSASTNVSQLITVQRPALKYLTAAAVRNEAYSEILCAQVADGEGPTLRKIYKLSEATTEMEHVPAHGVVLAVDTLRHHLYSIPAIFRQPWEDYSIYRFFEMPFNKVETVVGGTGYPKNFDKQSNLPRGRYMELAKEFQDYSTGGTAALPAFPYARPRPREAYGIFTKFDLKYHGLLSEIQTAFRSGFNAPIMDNLCTYPLDRFCTIDQYSGPCFPFTDEQWWHMPGCESWESDETLRLGSRAGKNILFFNYSRLIGEDASVIGGINTNTSQMTLGGDLGCNWDPAFSMVIFAFYQVVLQLNGEVGSIDQFN